MAQVPASRPGQGGRMSSRREHPLDRLQRDFDSLLRMWGGWFAPGETDFDVIRVWDFDVSDKDNEIVVRAELPGFDENEIDVQINNNVLTVRAEEEQKGDGQHEYRSFYRAITLPPGIDPDNVKANYRNGVLELHIPKAAEAQPRRIKVTSEARQQGGAATTAGPTSGSQAQQGAAPAASSRGTSQSQGSAGAKTSEHPRR